MGLTHIFTNVSGMSILVMIPLIRMCCTVSILHALSIREAQKCALLKASLNLLLVECLYCVFNNEQHN